MALVAIVKVTDYINIKRKISRRETVSAVLASLTLKNSQETLAGGYQYAIMQR